LILLIIIIQLTNPTMKPLVLENHQIQTMYHYYMYYHVLQLGFVLVSSLMHRFFLLKRGGGNGNNIYYIL